MEFSEIRETTKPIIASRCKTERYMLGIQAAGTLLKANIPLRDVVRFIYDAFRYGQSAYRLNKDDAWEVVTIASEFRARHQLLVEQACADIVGGKQQVLSEEERTAERASAQAFMNYLDDCTAARRQGGAQ